MNKIITVLTAAVALAFCSCASTVQRGGYVAPSTGKVSQRVDTAGQKITAAQGSVTKAQTHAKVAKAKVEQIEKIVPKTSENAELILSLKTEIDGLTDELLNTQLALQGAQDELTKAKTVDIPDLQRQVGEQTDKLNDTITIANQAIRDRDIATGKYHKLKFWIIGVAAAATLFLIYSILGIKMFAPPLLYVTIAAPVAVSTFLLFYL